MSTKATGTYNFLPFNCQNHITDFKNSTVPTKEQVLIPESLLKKRKTQEKTQAEREQARAEKKKVYIPLENLKWEIATLMIPTMS